jgi:hypothetical protein
MTTVGCTRIHRLIAALSELPASCSVRKSQSTSLALPTRDGAQALYCGRIVSPQSSLTLSSTCSRHLRCEIISSSGDEKRVNDRKVVQQPLDSCQLRLSGRYPSRNLVAVCTSRSEGLLLGLRTSKVVLNSCCDGMEGSSKVQRKQQICDRRLPISRAIIASTGDGRSWRSQEAVSIHDAGAQNASS